MKEDSIHTPQESAQFANELVDLLCVALTESTGGEVIARNVERQIGDGSHLDLLVTLQAAGEMVDVAVATLRHAYPRDIRGAVWKLEEHMLAAKSEKDFIPMVVAESLSSGAREQLRKRGIGYFERNGNLYLRRRQWLINIERPEKPFAKREASSLFTDSREMVVHALLTHRGQWLTGRELARISQTSEYTCSMVLQELERREWCESNGAGRMLRRRLIHPWPLLDAWAEQWMKRKHRRCRYYVFATDPNHLLAHLAAQADEAGIAFPWSFTGTAAANDYAPLLTSVDTAEIIVSPTHAKQLAEALRLKPADKGANVTLVERDGAGQMFREINPMNRAYIASPFILYLDLLDGRGRNQELAKHVLEKLKL